MRSAELKDFGELSRVVWQYFSELFQSPKLSVRGSGKLFLP